VRQKETNRDRGEGGEKRIMELSVNLCPILKGSSEKERGDPNIEAYGQFLDRTKTTGDRKKLLGRALRGRSKRALRGKKKERADNWLCCQARGV